jgi:hypothetical protein
MMFFITVIAGTGAKKLFLNMNTVLSFDFEVFVKFKQKKKYFIDKKISQQGMHKKC